MTKCAACGLDIAEGSRFCPSCGRAAGADDAITRTVAIPPSSRSQSVDGSRFPPGALLANRYRIVALLGRGGMGEVYRADDLTLGQQVALKFLPEAVASNPDAVTRFRNEVRLARQVSHPSVCRVYDLGEAEGHYFISMEYVDGENLDSLLRRIGRLPGDKALEIGRRLCAGLAAAHEKGILHRDLKPSNIMLDGRGQAILTDFGLAGVVDRIEGAEVRNGTPAYMAPEQLAGKEVTVKSDIYSLGLVLYEIFTGKRPFESDTLAGLMHLRKQSTPANPSNLVRDLDPAVERVILRCLEAEPARRPYSALSVAAALPGGNPLEAALAAGETPSPEMVVAAGEGLGLAPRIAMPLLLAVIAGLGIYSLVFNRSSGIERIKPEYSPEVLRQKARDILQRLGYNNPPADDAYGFSWDTSFLGYVENRDKPFPRWNDVLPQRSSVFQFWYRQSRRPMTGGEFHDDTLTPGMVTRDDPPTTMSGMINMELDAKGRLLYLEAIPEQLQESTKASASVDWSLLFRAAELDPAQFQPAEPLWTYLATSDTRMAWTGIWPGTTRPLRVEGAALRGRPVAFSLVGPWVKPWRAQSGDAPRGVQAHFAGLVLLVLVMCVAAPLLARRNLSQGKGDRHGALRLAVFIFCMQMALWLCRAHFGGLDGTFGTFLLALCTSAFYGIVIWTVYLALEPYVRRQWPQSLISWTSVLTGRLRDPIVGRDVLFGVGLGITWRLIGRVGDLIILGPRAQPAFSLPELLLGVRSTLGSWLLRMPDSIRSALLYFFLLFLLRVLLRNQWLAAAVTALFFTVLGALSSDHPMIDGFESLLIYAIVSITLVRLGFLALAAGLFVSGVLYGVPVTFNPSAWYFGSSLFMVGSVLVLAAWAFHTAIGGRRLWKQDPFS